MSFRPLALVALLVAGCASTTQVKQLEEKVASLEKQVEELKAAKPASGRPAAPAAPANPAAEEAATKLFDEVRALTEKGQMEEAKAKMAELNSKYGSTQVAAKAKKTAAELEVVGKAVTGLTVEKWYQGESKLDLAGNTPTLVVFWEAWCPHCRREVPKLEETYTKYKGKMNVVGLTKVTRSSSDEKVTEFIKENKVSYPMAKEKGDMSETFAVSGIPAAAVVKGGKIIWRGHPARLTDEMINSWL